MVGKVVAFLQNSINENKLSHAFLVETNNINKTENKIFELLKENNIIDKTKIENNISILILKANEEMVTKIIDKSQIINLQKFLNTKSMNNYYKVYFILKSELMNIPACNKLLKTLEEPNEQTIGFLLTENINKNIETIRSRCEIIQDQEEESLSPELSKKVGELNEILNYDYISFFKQKKKITEIEKTDLFKILELLKANYINSATDQSNVSILAKKTKIIDNMISMLNSNANIDLLLDRLYIELRK